MESIAICITTRNRRDVFDTSHTRWWYYMPKNARIFVVDDASNSDNFIDCDYRFQTQQGIAKAKNKCLELAQNYDHIFLADDDVYPKIQGWEKPYLESGLNHLALTFDKNSKGVRYSASIRCEGSWNGFKTYTAPNGCFLYLNKKVLETAGGFRPEFGIWGFEHVEYSQRIHLLGLTPHPYIDLPNSLDLMHVCDYYGEVKSSVTHQEKVKSAEENIKIWQNLGGKAEFVPFT